MPNEDLIRRTVALMEEHRDLWDQWTYIGLPGEDQPICGTTLCFAGFALVAEMGAGAFFARYLTVNGEGDWRVNDSGERSVGKDARAALGLNNRQQFDLFLSFVDDLDEYKLLITRVTGVTFP